MKKALSTIWNGTPRWMQKTFLLGMTLYSGMIVGLVIGGVRR